MDFLAAEGEIEELVGEHMRRKAEDEAKGRGSGGGSGGSKKITLNLGGA